MELTFKEKKWWDSWHDHFWGVCDGQGLNHLGLILMRVREELRGERDGS